MNQELLIFTQYDLFVSHVADDGLEFSPTVPYKKFKLFYHPQRNEIVYVKEIGFDENLHLQMLDFENSKSFTFNSQEQLKSILKEISYYV